MSYRYPKTAPTKRPRQYVKVLRVNKPAGYDERLHDAGEQARATADRISRGLIRRMHSGKVPGFLET